MQRWKIFATVLGASLAPVSVGQANLVSYWPFEGNAQDPVGGRNGTLVGNATFSTNTPGFDTTNSLDLDGSGDRVTYDVTGVDSLSGAYTVALWVNVRTIGGAETFFGTRGPTDTSFDAKYRAADIHGDIGTGSAWITTAADSVGVTPPIGSWDHVAYSVDSTGYDIYFNGNPVGSGSFSAVPLLFDANHDIAIGAFRSTGGEDLDGLIDDVGVFDRALSAGEALAIVNLANEPTLQYDLGEVDQLLAAFNQSTPQVTVDGTEWRLVTDGSIGGNPGDITSTFVHGLPALALNLGGGNGMAIVPVPEPSTGILLLLAGSVLVRSRKRPGR